MGNLFLQNRGNSLALGRHVSLVVQRFPSYFPASPTTRDGLPDEEMKLLVSWCFEPSQPQRITLGL